MGMRVRRSVVYGLMAIMVGTAGITTGAATAQAATGIRFSQLTNAQRLPDGDIVQASVLPGGVPKGVIEVHLRLAGVTWWKGIQSGPIVLCQAQDNQPDSTAQFSVSDFQAHGLQLWKAKTFGIHTQMYDVTDAGQNMSGGHSYVFVWERD